MTNLKIEIEKGIILLINDSHKPQKFWNIKWFTNINKIISLDALTKPAWLGT